MTTKTVWAAYFSATNTTKKVVTQIARRLSQQTACPMEIYDFTHPQARKTPKAFAPGDLVVFGTPVYAGRVPNLLIRFVAAVQGNGALAVPVVCYGNRNYDDALMELRNTLEAGGFHTVAGGAFSCQHAFSLTQAAGRPDRSDLTIASGFADQIFRKVEALTSLESLSPVAVKGNDPVGPYYTPRDRHGNPINILKVKPKTDPDKCGGCGLCAELCPMGSIDPADVSQVRGICIKCCACVKKCPSGAKYFDDPGYLFHQHELEDVYTRRAENEWFV